MSPNNYYCWGSCQSRIVTGRIAFAGPRLGVSGVGGFAQGGNLGEGWIDAGHAIPLDPPALWRMYS